MAAALGLARPLIAQNVGPVTSSGQGNYGPPVSTNGGNVSFGGGAAPTLNSACGTSPVGPLGTDTAFKFQSGTSTSNTCQATFATPWNNPPVCSVQGETNVPAWHLAGNSGIVISGVLDSSVYHVQCFGRPGG